jgi:hypothetical protein
MRQCSICIHKNLVEIDKQITSGCSIASIAREFEASEDAIWRHKQHIDEDSAIKEDNAGEAIPEKRYVQPTTEDVDKVRNALPCFQGDIRTKSLCSYTNLSELTVVLAMIKLGYESVTLRNSNAEVWRPVGIAENVVEEKVQVRFLLKPLDRQRAWLPASVAASLASQGIVVLREEA